MLLIRPKCVLIIRYSSLLQLTKLIWWTNKPIHSKLLETAPQITHWQSLACRRSSSGRDEPKVRTRCRACTCSRKKMLTHGRKSRWRVHQRADTDTETINLATQSQPIGNGTRTNARQYAWRRQLSSVRLPLAWWIRFRLTVRGVVVRYESIVAAGDDACTEMH